MISQFNPSGLRLNLNQKSVYLTVTVTVKLVKLAGIEQDILVSSGQCAYYIFFFFKLYSDDVISAVGTSSLCFYFFLLEKSETGARVV